MSLDGKPWDERRQMQLILLYEKHPCLWNDRSPDYRSKWKRSKAMENIIDELKLPKKERFSIIHKITKIRNVYTNELRKIASFKNMGIVYKPKLYWFDAVDRFLRGVIKDTLFPLGDDTETAVTNEVKFNYERLLVDDNSDDEMQTEEEDTFNEPIDNETGEALSLSPGTSSRASSEPKAKDDDKLVLLTSIMQEIKESVENEAEGDISSDFEMFGQSVAAQLDCMPSEDALQLQAEIQLLITNKRIQRMKKERHHSNDSQ